MSKYTITIKNLCSLLGRVEVESWFQDYELTDFLTQEEINVINTRGTWNKEKLASLIVDHYYMREIGYETSGLFKHYVKVTMREIMESKAPLIYSSAIKYEPLVNVDFTETFTRNIKDDTINTGTSNSTANASGLTVNSDTPQGQINKNEILQGKYATNTGAGESTNTDTTTTNMNENKNTDENYSKNVKGNSGVSATAQHMIQQYRDNIRAINYEIIEELKPLFMGLW